MIAQAAGILLARRSAPEDMCGGALLGVRRMRFVRPLPPSQACRITVNLEAALRGGVMVRGEIDADGERIATGVLAVHSPEVSNAKRARTAV
jgi:3-hydroxymyristoyl/3-hydroxydecanoyl-(acyl carrier protein) dehydratase